MRNVDFRLNVMRKKTAYRDHKMTLRLSENENETLQKIADEYGVSRMEAIRKLITKESSRLS